MYLINKQTTIELLNTQTIPSLHYQIYTPNESMDGSIHVNVLLTFKRRKESIDLSAANTDARSLINTNRKIHLICGKICGRQVKLCFANNKPYFCICAVNDSYITLHGMTDIRSRSDI